ncbi:hypothetical protein [Luteibacter sp. CQ10]|uniref:hypothetical protein n=1 Tax=Luteibacter sp. CQ10 TaxID=2805821 RepID=UPI0034A2DB4B
MTQVIDVLSGNPGVGKTKQFIEQVQEGKRYVYAAPTRRLAEEVMGRLTEQGRSYTPIFTSPLQDVGSVIHRANVALGNKTDTILVITHKCLASVRPELLDGWNLYVDECLKTEDIEAVTVLASEFEHVIAPYVGDCDDNGGLILNPSMMEEAWEIHAQGIEDARNRRTRNKTLLLVLDAMLSQTKTATAVPKKNDKGKDVVRISVEGFTDYTKPFSYADTVTLMGANVERSLVARHLHRKAFTLRVNKRRSERNGLPVILPLVRDNEGAYISKSMLLTLPDGSRAKEWTKDCFGQHVLNTALAFVGDARAIFASHEWCRPALPANVERTPFDTRGLNQWRDRKVSIHMLHGNPSPDELGPAKRIIEKMGIPLQEGRDAMRWEREGDQLIQFSHRTMVRDEDTSDTTYHIVTSYTQARRLMRDFDGACIIDTSLMIEPPEQAPTEKKADRGIERENLASQARTLKAEGMSQRAIASRLDVSLGKVNKLLR